MGYPHLPFPSPPPPYTPFPPHYTPLPPIFPNTHALPPSPCSPFHFLCNFSFPWSSDVPPSFHLFPVFFSVLSPFRSPPICSSQFITSPVIWGFRPFFFPQSSHVPPSSFSRPTMFRRPFWFLLPQSSNFPPSFLLSPVLLCSSVISSFSFPQSSYVSKNFSIPYSPPMFLRSFSFCQSSYVPQFFLLLPVLLCSSVLSPFPSPPMFLSSFYFCISFFAPPFFSFP